MENFGVKVLVETGQLLRGNFGGTYLVESPAFQNSPTVIQKWGFGCYVKNVIKIRFGWMNHFIILSKMAKFLEFLSLWGILEAFCDGDRHELCLVSSCHVIFWNTSGHTSDIIWIYPRK